MISSMARMYGGTNIASAIRASGNQLSKGSREENSSVIILTDGRVDSYQVDEAAICVESLRRELPNAQVFAVGVGRGVDKHELVRIINENRVHSYYRHPNAFHFGADFGDLELVR